MSDAPRLLHYSDKPIKAVRSVAQVGHHDKPAGLWVSVEGDMDWREWCEVEEYGDPALQICYEVSLNPSAKILRLETPSQIVVFTDEYGCDPFMGPMAGRTVMFGRGIQWQRVADNYAGIIIAPYQRMLRSNDLARWYYSWDCASGCIWDKDAVAAITKARGEPVTA